MAAQIDLSVDRDSEVPLGTQLGWTLRTLIRTARLAPGTRLPGVRELAEQAGVHVNTVRAVYQRLEHKGLIESQQGSGTFVSAASPQASAVGAIATTAARAARESGIDPRAVAIPDAAERAFLLQNLIFDDGQARWRLNLAAIEQEMPGLVGFPAVPEGRTYDGSTLFVAGGWGPRDAGPGSAERRGRAKGEPGDADGEPTGGQRPPATRRDGRAGEPETPAAPQGERARRRRLRQEIAELEGELGYLEPLAPATEPPRLPAGRILTAAELEEVRDRLVGRVVELREARAEARRRALEPPAPEVAPARAGREWGHGGVWTGGRVRTASFGA